MRRLADSKVVTLSGVATSSTVTALPAGAALTGFVTHPPSPCTGGIATAQLAFGG